MKGKLNIEGLNAGDPIPKFGFFIEKKNYRKYNRIIREINPIHINKKFAQDLGFRDVVVAGNFIYTLVPKWLIDWISQNNVVKKIQIKFHEPVYVDEKFIISGKILEILKDTLSYQLICEFQIEKITGELTANGIAELVIPI